MDWMQEGYEKSSRGDGPGACRLGLAAWKSIWAIMVPDVPVSFTLGIGDIARNWGYWESVNFLEIGGIAPDFPIPLRHK